MSIPTVFNNPEAPGAELRSKANERTESGSNKQRLDKASPELASANPGSQLGVQHSDSGGSAAGFLDHLSFVQTAESALEELHTTLQRIRDLTVQAASSPSGDRRALQQEVSRLVGKINLIQQETAHKTAAVLGSVDILAGQLAAVKLPPTGVNPTALTTSSILDLSAAALGVASLPVATKESARKSIGAIDHALSLVSNQRTHLAILQNRLERAVRSLNIAAENVLASGSPIPNLSVALETVDATRNQILLQAAVAARAQANAHTQVVLQLLT